jgi:hypothetical protein
MHCSTSGQEELSGIFRLLISVSAECLWSGWLPDASTFAKLFKEKLKKVLRVVSLPSTRINLSTGI